MTKLYLSRLLSYCYGRMVPFFANLFNPEYTLPSLEVEEMYGEVAAFTQEGDGGKGGVSFMARIASGRGVFLNCDERDAAMEHRSG